MPNTTAVERIDPKDLAAVARSAATDANAAAEQRALEAAEQRYSNCRSAIEQGLQQLFGWTPEDVSWGEWEDPYHSFGAPEPEARAGGLTFRRDPRHHWMLRIVAKRQACDHEVAVDIQPAVDRTYGDGSTLLMIGRLLERAEGEECPECRYEEQQRQAQEMGHMPTPAAPASLGERLEELVRAIVRDEMDARGEL